MGMTIEEAKKLDQFLCSDCSSDDDAKRPLNQFPLSPSLEKKVLTLSLAYLLVFCLYFDEFLRMCKMCIKIIKNQQFLYPEWEVATLSWKTN